MAVRRADLSTAAWMCWFSCLVANYWHHCRCRIRALDPLPGALQGLPGPWRTLPLALEPLAVSPVPGAHAAASSLSPREALLRLPRPSRGQSAKPIVWVCGGSSNKSALPGQHPHSCHQKSLSKRSFEPRGRSKLFSFQPLQLFASTYHAEVQSLHRGDQFRKGRHNPSPNPNT